LTSVDAGANEVGKSAVLVKLIDHETVEGTQPLRQALPASFEIAIKDYRSKPARLAGKFSTGIARRVYTNAELGCRLTAPGEDWSEPQGLHSDRRCGESRQRVGRLPHGIPVNLGRRKDPPRVRSAFTPGQGPDHGCRFLICHRP
jgi:hypothetical protein